MMAVVVLRSRVPWEGSPEGHAVGIAYLNDALTGSRTPLFWTPLLRGHSYFEALINVFVGVLT